MGGEKTLIDGLSGFSMVVFSIFFDLMIVVCNLSVFFDPLSMFYSGIATGTFWFWFSIHGASRTKAKNIILLLRSGTGIAKSIPGLGILPFFLTTTVLSIYLHNREVKKREQELESFDQPSQPAYWNNG